MPVYNGLPYLDAAVQSILAQTRDDFEFVIYDDASTDGSYHRLQEWAQRDSRIKLVRGEVNLGPALSSNAVVDHASGAVIARMDADDLSAPDRLERQAEILSSHPDVGLVATLCHVINDAGEVLRGPEPWRVGLRSWSKPFPHGSMMFRRELFDAIGGYREECEFWEDLDFVVRASQKSPILVIPRALYSYRQSPSGTRLASAQQRVENAMDVRYRSLDRIAKGLPYDDVLRAERHEAGGTVDPRIFVSLGSLALLARQRPNLARRFLARARLKMDVPTLISATWVAWATLSPGTLRWLMEVLARVRDRRLREPIDENEPIEWRVPTTPK